MAFINSEQYISISGLGLSGTGTSVYKASLGDQKFTAVATSGSQTATSGGGVLVTVIGIGGGLLSGTIFTSSQSGATILVVDGVSGVIPVLQSGATRYASNTNGVLYQFAFGTQSGAATAGLPIIPPDALVNAVFISGLVVVCSGGTAGGYGLSVIFSKAI